MRLTALGSGRETQTWLLGPGPGKLGCSGCMCLEFVSPFPFPIHMPPPSFLFLFRGHKNFLFSSWLKMLASLSWRPSGGAGHSSPGDIRRRRNRETLP